MYIVDEQDILDNHKLRKTFINSLLYILMSLRIHCETWLIVTYLLKIVIWIEAFEIMEVQKIPLNEVVCTWYLTLIETSPKNEIVSNWYDKLFTLIKTIINIWDKLSLTKQIYLKVLHPQKDKHFNLTSFVYKFR